MPQFPSTPTVAVSGATGFVGRHLIPLLAESARVIALSRSMPRLTDSNSPITWRQCDFFSLKESEAALAGCDTAIYLVHSMMPQARLTQGRFEDIDLWLADNFARSAATNDVKKIIFLSGIRSETHSSPHLRSREEVEHALGAYGTPVICLQAGMILGAGGSSFNMMKRLVERLPVMICPAWTKTLSAPIHVEDVVQVISRVCTDSNLPEGTYDLGGKDTVTYLEMLRETARLLGLKRKMVPFPYVNPRVSALWVRLISGSPKQLVIPLVMSLKCDMIPKGVSLFERYGIASQSFQQALTAAIRAEIRREESPKITQIVKKRNRPENVVFSLQRLPWAQGIAPKTIVDRYFGWLNQCFWRMIQVRVQSSDVAICVFSKFVALRFRRLADRCSGSREILQICGGFLTSAQKGRAGRFECRSALGGQVLLIGVLDYRPRLPWWVYKYTQALLHKMIMLAYSHKR